MASGAAFVARLLSDTADIHGAHGAHGAGAGLGGGDSFSPGATVLAEADPQVVLGPKRAQMAALEADFAADPEAVVRRFRRFYQDDSLTVDDVRQWMETWKFALESPDDFATAVSVPQGSFGLGDWLSRLGSYLHIPPKTSPLDQAIVDRLVERFSLDPDMRQKIRPNLRQFETLDPGWVPLLLEKADELMKVWPAGLAPYRRHENHQPGEFVYPGTASYDGTPNSRVAIFSDFGTGYYHSEAIARQIARWGYPHAFHLGDVYYAGRAREFAQRFAPQLQTLVQNTELFGLAENHELYSGGKAYLAYFDQLRAQRAAQGPTGKGGTRQEGSYFCVRFEHHQIIGIDVNWGGRQTFADPQSAAWLRKVIAQGGTRTNILLTGSAPYLYGGAGQEPLLGQLWEFVKDGQIQLWFWGDVHYGCLFPRDAIVAPFIGSCVGHGGYPGGRRKQGESCWATPTWVEDQSRFPKWTKLRQDVTNNGWCELTLRPDRGVDLLYVDWLSAKRFAVRFTRQNETLVRAESQDFPGREDDAPAIALHRPA